MIFLYLIGLFLTGCAFQRALDGHDLLGMPPRLVAPLAVLGAIGYAATIAGT